MMDRIIGNSRKVDILAKSMNAQMARNRVIANNIANVNTPGFRREEVHFEDSLKKALSKKKLDGARTNNKHMALGSQKPGDVNHRISHPVDPTQPSGVNNVDIDNEMADLAENQIRFKYSVKMMGLHYQMLNAAIKGKSIQ